MDLEDKSRPAANIRTGRQTLNIVAGKILKIETSPGGEDVLNETVPAGKVWEVYINIDVIETNV